MRHPISRRTVLTGQARRCSFNSWRETMNSLAFMWRSGERKKRMRPFNLPEQDGETMRRFALIALLIGPGLIALLMGPGLGLDADSPAAGTKPGPAEWPQFRGPDGQGHASARGLA